MRAALALAVVLGAASLARADGIDLAPLREAADAGAATAGPRAKSYAALARALAKPDRPGLADEFAKMLRVARDLRGSLAGDAALAAALDACLDATFGSVLSASDAEACAAVAPVASRAARRSAEAGIESGRRTLAAAVRAREEGRADVACRLAGRAGRAFESVRAAAEARVRREDRKAAGWHVVLEDLGGALWGVTATAGSDPVVYAVGSPDATDALFLRGTAEGWVRIPVGTTDAERNADLHWVSILPGAGVWACGEDGLVVRYDPVAGNLATVDAGTTGNLWGLWGSGPDDVWIVGGDAASGTVLRHFDGDSWSEVPAPVGAGRILYKIWGRAADDVWACGQRGALVHWDGDVWTAVPTDVETDLLTVHGEGDRVTAVGQVTGATILERQGDGTFASQFLAGADSISASGVFLPAKGDPWAVGYAPGGEGTVLRREKGRWRSVPDAPRPFGIDFHAVHVDDTGAVWIVGGRLGQGTDGVLLHRGARTPSSGIFARARLAEDVQPILAAHCTDACHAGLFAAEDLDLSDAVRSSSGLVRTPARQAALLRVLPGRPSASYLWRKVEGTHLAAGGSGDPMPQGRPLLLDPERDVLRAWILGLGR